jgi:hypothetical protein
MPVSRRMNVRIISRIILVTLAVAIILVRLVPHRHTRPAPTSIPGLSTTSPLNQPGGGPAPAEAYDGYSALYRAPMQEPLVIAQNSVTDIPQVGGSCLKPSTPQEHEMTDAFVAANQQAHRWDQNFTIPAGFQLLPPNEVAQVQSCLETHGRDAAKCNRYKQIAHVRFLGVPGFDRTHTHALVSVIRSCGSYCGSGGIFAVQKSAGTWQRSDTTGFTRDCSWMY